jgi:hypothetical protein
MEKILVSGWNAAVTLPENYSQSQTYPTIIFFPGWGEVGTDINKLLKNGPHAYLAAGGTIPGFIVISLQPSAAFPAEQFISERILLLKAKYRIGKLFLTGLSHGGWCCSTYVSQGDYYKQVTAIATYVGMFSDDNPGLPYSYDPWALLGGKFLCVEQKYDGRYMKQVVDRMNVVAPNSATYIQTLYDGGGHSGWEYFYVRADQYLINGKMMNVYEYFASMVTVEPPPPPPPPPIKTVQSTITLYTDGTYSLK